MRQVATAQRERPAAPRARARAAGRAGADGAPGQLLALQRQAGNAAVGALLGARPVPVQRCGDHPCDCSEERREAHAARHPVQRLTDDEKLIDLTSPDLAGDARLQSAFDNAPALRRGERGAAVSALQRGLMDDGFVMRKSVGPGGPDGDYGAETEAMVKAFQTKHGLDVDGTAGRQTLGKLDELNLATGGRGRGGGGAVAPGDTGFEVRGKFRGAASVPDKLFFTETSATLDAAERAKLPALGTPADRALDLRGFRSEDEDPGLAALRVQEVAGALAAAPVDHTGTRNLLPLPDAGAGRLEYRTVRMVEVVESGQTPATPDCSAGPVVGAPDTALFTDANDRALALIDNAITQLDARDPTAVAVAVSLFRSRGSIPTIVRKLRALRTRLQRWTAAGEHRFHNDCDPSCVGTIAYIPGDGNRTLTLCPIFMSEPDLDERAGTLIHEGSHREPQLDTDDHAYLFERVINHLEPAEALDNADSYLALVRTIDSPGSVTIGPDDPDVAGAGMTDVEELRQANQAVAFAEKWASDASAQLGSMYATIVESRPGGTWTNGFYEDMMRRLSRRSGFTTPPALPTDEEQHRIAGIVDRVTIVHRFFEAPITFERASDASEPVSVRPGRVIRLSDGFFRMDKTAQVGQILTVVIQRVDTISVDQQPMYQTTIDDVRRQMGTPTP